MFRHVLSCYSKESLNVLFLVFLVFGLFGSLNLLVRYLRCLAMGEKGRKEKKRRVSARILPFLWELRLLGLDVSVRMRRVFGYVRWDGMSCFFRRPSY